MKIKERLSNEGASEQAIAELEAVINARLPDDYRMFLAKHNGGCPESSKFEFQENDKPSNSSVRFFFTLDPKGKPYVMARKVEVYRDRIPSGLLPIGCDSFGNLLLLDVAGRKRGAILFWDHEREDMSGNDEPSWANVSLIAPTFNDFLDQLK